MLNNRQTGRRRGRSNQRPPSNNGGRGAEQGNRIDNRARGNAPQLLEKYNTLARDAQQQGDRVMAEYYLQFADHYFRVVADSRARYEENRPRQENTRDDGQQGDWQPEDGNSSEGADGEERMAEDGGDEGYDGGDRPYQQQRPQQNRQQQQPRRDNYRGDGRDAAPRQDREPRPEREPRQDREPREARPEREPRPERAPREDRALREERPQREFVQAETAPAERPARRPRTPRVEAPVSETNGFDVSILPPAISVAASDEAPAPKPRARRVKKDVAVEATAES